MDKVLKFVGCTTLFFASLGGAYKLGVDHTVDYYDSQASQKSESEVDDRIITLGYGTYNMGAYDSTTSDLSMYGQFTVEPKENLPLGTDKEITWMGYSYHPVDSLDSMLRNENRLQSLSEFDDATTFDHTRYLRFHNVLVNSNDGDTPRMYYLCDGEVDASVLSDNQDQFIIRQEITESQ